MTQCTTILQNNPVIFFKPKTSTRRQFWIASKGKIMSLLLTFSLLLLAERGAAQYCAAGATDTPQNEKISNITFNTINNTSTGVDGYENFTSISTTVGRDMSYDFTGTIEIPYAADEIIVWIDFNQDFDFTDAGEEVFNSPTGVGPHSGVITIPASASLGTTRMRVRLHDTLNQPNFTPCGNSKYGQVEDYTLNIVPCIGPNPGNTISSAGPPICPSTPFTLSLQNSLPSGTTYQWQSSLNNSTWTDISGATSATYASTGITFSTWFRCRATVCTVVLTSTTLYMNLGIPNPGLTNTNVGLPACTNTSFTLSLQNNQPSGATYQWQSSLNNSTWTDISGANSATYTSTGITSTTYFRCGVTSCSVTWNSASLEMTIYAAPNPGNTIASVTPPVCPNTAFTLSLQNSQPSGTTYQWQSSPNGSTWTNISGATSTTYFSSGIPTTAWYRCQATICTMTTSSNPIQMVIYPVPGNTLLLYDVAPVCAGYPVFIGLQNTMPVGTTYQWQSSPNGSTWTNISGANNNFLHLAFGISTATWYRCRVTYCGTVNSNPLYLTVQTCYCSAAGSNQNLISNVSFNTINNPSSNTGGYEDFTAISTSIEQSNTYPFTLTQTGNWFNTETIVWIDFNQDLDFGDAGEEVLHTPKGSGTFTGNIQVPSSSPLGATRMRIRINDTTYGPGNTTPCGSTSIGQVEDYTVNIDPCSGTPSPGNTVSSVAPPICPNSAFTLSLQNSQPSGTTYQWQSSSNGTTWAYISGATSATRVVSGITTTTWYRCQVTRCEIVFSNPLQITVLPAPNPGNTISSAGPPACPSTAFTLSLQNNQPIGTTYQWQSSPNNSTWTNISGATSATYASPGISTATWFRCRATLCNTTTNSTALQMTVYAVPNPGNTITSVPSPICLSTAFTLSLQNSQPSGTTYQWQDSPDGNTWTNISGAISATYASAGITTTTWFRCQASLCNVTTNSTALQMAIATTPNPGNTVSSQSPPICLTYGFTLSLQNSQPSGTTYQWQSSPDGSTWTNINGATNGTRNVSSISTTTWYRCQVTKCAITAFSDPLQMTTEVCYCPAAATNTQPQYEKISLVTFNTINNASSSSAGYENFTSVSTDVEQGTSYDFTGTVSNPYVEDEMIVWIDFNQDKDFEDADEKVFDSPTGTGPFSSSITIPINALTGTTRMRIRLHDTAYGPNTTPCLNSDYGQVEDYNVNIVPCIGTPNPGNTVSSVTPPICPSAAFTLSLQNSQPSGATYQWQSSQDNNTWTDISGETSATYASTGITATTWFRCQVTVCSVTTNSTALQMVVEVAPSPGNTVSSITPPVCPSSAFTLSLQNSQPSGTTYQWQSSPDNSTWTDISGATNATYDSTGITTATWYRCRATLCSVSTNSTALQMTVATTPNPGNTISSVGPPVCSGSAFTLSLQNSQPSGTTYQWQSSPDNSTWTDISGATSATYASTGIITATWYRCQVIICSLNTNSTALQMTIADAPNPGNTVSNSTPPVCPSTAFTLSLQNSQPNGTTFQWQSSQDNSTWTDISGATSATYASTGITTATWYRCQVTLCSTVSSTALQVTVSAAPNPGNTVSNVGLPICPSTAFTLSLENSQPSGTTYQWQSSPNNSTWTNISGATSETYPSTGITSSTWFRCQVILCSTVNSTALQMTVSTAPNPGNTISSAGPPVCSSSAFTLSLQNSQPSGTTYQWQSSLDNSTWTDISGATNATYASAGITSSTWFRCRATLCSTTSNSNALKMTLATTPILGGTVSSVGLPVCPSTAFTLSFQTAQPNGTTYQWQSSPNNSTWTDISGAISATYSSVGITSSTWFRCRATFCSMTSNSHPLQMTVATTPNPGNTLSNVVLPACPSSAFTLSLQTNQPSGTTYQWQSSPNNSTWTDISGATSAIYNSVGITSSIWYRCRATICSISTNSTALQMTVATTPNPGNTVSSVAPPVCVGNEAFVLSLQNSQQTGSTYQWQSSPDNSTWTNISGATSATRSVTSISSTTWFRCQVTKCGITVASVPLQMTTETCYCSAGATQTQNEKISLITFNTINKASSSTAGYENFTAVSTTLEQGSSYVFTGTISNPNASDEIIVWIDFNQDLDFDDADEKVFDSPTGTGPHSSSITIPSNAPIGTTRMRVRLHDTSNGPNTTPCGTSTYGQVEDYSINIAVMSMNRIWVGGNGSWDVATNWNPAYVPTSDNPVIISSGSPTIPASYSAATKEIAISNGADLIVGYGATLTVNSTTSHSIYIQGAGSSLQNTGTITISGSGTNKFGILLSNTGTAITNQGTIEIPYTANIGSGGIYNSGGTINNQPGGIITIDRSTSPYPGLGAVGASTTITNEGLINIGMNPNASIGAKGIFVGIFSSVTNAVSGIIKVFRCETNSVGLSVDGDGTFTNNGTMDIGVGGNIPGDGINVNSTFQNNGTITIANVSDKLIEGNGTEYFHNNINGVVQGTGTILATAFHNNNGTLKPGYSPGLMTFNSDEDFSTSTLEIEVNGPGTAGTDFDQVVTNGIATLGDVSILNLHINFAPTSNQQITILNAAGLVGTFTTVTGLTSGWTVLYDLPNTGNVTLSFALLPIELMYFKGKADGPVNQLEWATASELNSQYHAVERSADGISNWQEIGRRNAAGTSNEQHTYQLLDEQPLAVGYYRLKAVDFDGQYEYSNLVVIERETKGFDITSLFPNPTSGVLNLRVAVSEPVPVLISIYDAFGCLVQQVQTAEAKEGVNDFSVNVAQLPAGLYFVKIANKDSSSVRYFVKQ